MGSFVVVDAHEAVELGLELVNAVSSWLCGEPFLEGLLEAFDFATGGWMVGSGVFLIHT